jgi:hypothetical protein
MIESAMKEIKQKILDEYAKGRIVFLDIEGLKTIPIADFVKQPIEGILYDLNRLEEVILANMDDPKWVNDYALVKVLKFLTEKKNESPKCNKEV